MAEKSEVKTDEKAFKQHQLVVFGATGATGTEVVKQGLELGHNITAIIRTPENFKLRHENLKIVKGDAYDIETFEAELSGKDAVMSCLGSTSIGPFATTTLYSDTMKVIFEAMKRHSVSRFVVLSSWCTKKGPESPWFFEWILRPFLLGGILKDIAVMEDFLESTDPTEMNYTIVRPPQLTYATGNGNYKIEEGQCNTGTSASIPRADVAHFMLVALETDKYDRKAMAIASLKQNIIMKLLVFGGTGPTGQEVVKQALELSHIVTVIARTPENMEIRHDNLEVLQGDICDLSSFESALAGKDAVLSCLGSKGTKGPFAFTSLYSESIANIVEAMKRHKVRRIIAVTSWCTQPGPNNPWFIEWFLKPFIIGANLRDMAMMEEFLQDTKPNEINYTIVKPPGLSLAEGNGNYQVDEGQCNVGTLMRIPRADVAHFMLKTLETKEYDRKCLAIASNYEQPS
ncbi:uncharacterized protein LOC114533069 [Dendronephthya gigantea]|uniref:uncharacterized protein LOC114533069 n=1 Tax=Dendronephthya gigantea TaxID=151771 RepID=UPI00106C4FDF|nr:uncharacterized protein LOC114533069 [Dendronephthya gigantea]